MISNFTSVVTWFRDITSSLFTWFFDLTDSNKIMFFIVPVLVMGAIFVVFEYVLPMIFDLPFWGVKANVISMTPKNTLSLKADKALIPRKPNKMQIYKNSGIRSNSTKDLRSMKTSDLRSMKSSDFRSMKVSDVRVMKTSDIKSMKPADIRSMKPADIRSMKPADIRSMKPADIRSMKPADIRSMKPIDLRPINPAEIRSNGSYDLRSMNTSQIRINGINSRLINSHSGDSAHISGNQISSDRVSRSNSSRIGVNSSMASRSLTTSGQAVLKKGLESVENYARQQHREEESARDD